MAGSKKTGRLIRYKRNEMGMTQDQLSKIINFTPAAISAWENGVRYPGPDAQLGLYNALGLNAVELLVGLEMFDEDMKKKIAAFMDRIDENVFVAGMVKDEDGNEFYLDLSDCEIVAPDDSGELSDKWIPYTKYHNVEPADKSQRPPELPKSDYDSSKVYINHGVDIFKIPVEILEQMGRPHFFDIMRSPDDLDIALRFSFEEGMFDIQEETYNGQWAGLGVYGGEFGKELCRTLRIRWGAEPLEVAPILDPERHALIIHFDEAKRVNVDFRNLDFLLPGWQHDEFWAEEEEEDED